MPRESFQPSDCLSPLDSRYYGADPAVFAALHPYLSEEAVLAYQIKVEQALVAELEAAGIAPRGISSLVAGAAGQITGAEVYAEEQRIHHNIRALVNCIRTRLPDRCRGYVHLFATSNDIMDTAKAVSLRDVCREVVLPDLCAMVAALIERARAYADAPQIGRTHGRHAEPITVGYWLANFVDRLGQRAEVISQAAANLRGKFSGAVGAHNALALRFPDEPAMFETRMLARLGLRPPENSVSTQVVQPEYLTDLAHALVSGFSVLANLADDCRHLMRSEIEELQDRGGAARVGSSTMPHKINPKDFENVKSLWKAFLPRIITVYLDQLSEHQRDLTNSASSRFFNELVAGFDYAVRRLHDAIGKVEINHDALERNLAQSDRWTVAEPLYISLALTGHPDPYDASRSLVARARDSHVGLLSLLKDDPAGAKLLDQLDPEHREMVLNPRKYIGDSASRTRLVCDAWKSRLDLPRLTAPLQRPCEAEGLIVAQRE